MSSVRPVLYSVSMLAIRAVPSLDDLEREILRAEATISVAIYRQLVALREFDERKGWHEQGATCCTAWLSWRIGLSPGAARDRMRTAHALARLPQISAALERGEVSYSQVRALTRVARDDNEAEWLNIAHHSTASQLERMVRGCRQAQRAAAPDFDEQTREERSLVTYFDDTGMLVLQGRLPPVEGARLQKVLDAIRMESPSVTGGDKRQRQADALVEVVERATSCSGGCAGEHPKLPAPQIVVHVAEQGLHSHSPDLRREIEHGPSASAESVRRLACDAETIRMLHGNDGKVLHVGRRTRVVSAAIRRALEHRDGRCRFPGCENTRTDAHHIVHWADGGETSTSNLVLLCRRHHTRVHEERYAIERRGDDLIFIPPEGTPLSRGPRFSDVVPWDDEPRAGVFISDWDGDPPDYQYIAEVMS